jgi:hypothetical protein
MSKPKPPPKSKEERRAERIAKWAAIAEAFRKRMDALADSRDALKAELRSAIDDGRPLSRGLVARVDRTILACDELYGEEDDLRANLPNDLACDLACDMNLLAASIWDLDGYIGLARRDARRRRASPGDAGDGNLQPERRVSTDSNLTPLKVQI